MKNSKKNKIVKQWLLPISYTFIFYIKKGIEGAIDVLTPKESSEVLKLEKRGIVDIKVV